MGHGRRCGCWSLTELDAERERHRLTLEENERYAKEIQNLRDELLHVHSTITDLERRYSDLACKYRDARQKLNEVTSVTSVLKEQSEEVTEDNMRLRANCKKMEDKVNHLQHKVEGAEEAIEQERLKRSATEMNLNKDLAEVERNCSLELKRASSAFSLDTQHLKQEISFLELELQKEKSEHSVTVRKLHQTEHLLQHHKDHVFRHHQFPHHVPHYGSHSQLWENDFC